MNVYVALENRMTWKISGRRCIGRHELIVYGAELSKMVAWGDILNPKQQWPKFVKSHGWLTPVCSAHGAWNDDDTHVCSCEILLNFNNCIFKINLLLA